MKSYTFAPENLIFIVIDATGVDAALHVVVDAVTSGVIDVLIVHAVAVAVDVVDVVIAVMWCSLCATVIRQALASAEARGRVPPGERVMANLFSLNTSR